MKEEHQLGDAPIQEEYKEAMRQLAHFLDDYFNNGLKGKDRVTGYVLLVFPFGDNPEQRCNFISNGADRRDIVVLMKEMIARFEGQPEMKGHA
jgi:hypothetical protein